MKHILELRTRLSNFINRNTGWLIAAAIVFFGLYNVAFSKDNQILIQNTKDSSQTAAQASLDAKAAAEAAQKTLAGQGKAVATLVEDNRKQTELIICLLSIHGANTVISDVDEENCRVVVEEAQETQAQQQAEAQPQSQPDSSLNQGQGGAPNPPQPEPPAEQPDSVIDTVFNTLDTLVSPITNLLRGIGR